MKPRIIYIHGNGTTHWSFGWAKWLRAELEKRGYPTFFETFPDSIIARAEYWLPFLQDFVHASEDDVILGWSSGAVAAMRFAEKHALKGSVLMSPSMTDLDDELEKQSGYFDTPWDWTNIRRNQNKIALFYGDDDPYIPQQEFKQIALNLHPDATHKLAKRGHFIDQPTFPEVLEYITKTF